MQKQEKPEMKTIVKILMAEESVKRKEGQKPTPSISEDEFAKKFKRLKVEFIM